MIKPVHLKAAIVSCSIVGLFAAAWPAAVAASSESEERANLSLTSFSLLPQVLHLKAGRPVLLRVANDSSAAHDLTAPEFFAAATVRNGSQYISNGKLALSPHGDAIIALIPRAGLYPARCSRPFHKILGMSGTIVVDP